MMNADPKYWTLWFDGTGFRLRETAQSAQPASKYRILEESLETILFHWANKLLPAPRLQMVGRSGSLECEQDLLAVDELGRVHIFELKKDRAGAASLFQLVSYLTGRPRDDEYWVRKTIAHTLWYGEKAHACRLAGLAARQWTETLRTGKSRRVAGRAVLYVERLEAKLERLVELASERTGLNLTSEAFDEITRSLLEEEFGGSWRGPIADPEKVLDQVADLQLSPHWQLGRTRPGIVIWMIAPDVEAAASAAQPLIERGLEIHCVSVDVQEVAPGTEWSIAVTVPKDHAANCAMANAFGGLLAAIVDRHLEECPEAASRLYLGLQPATSSWVTGKGWGELGWRTAGGSSVVFMVREDHIEIDLFNSNWTDGRALAMRRPLLRLCGQLRREHPSSWPWSYRDPEVPSNQVFVDAAVRLANAFWRGLEEIGALEVDRWAYWMPPE
jgi:hypothetical protein